MYKIQVYVPEKYIEVVKAALFEAGAGKVGNYENCSWQTLGQGQFKPIDGSNPAIGSHNKLELIKEYSLEMICDDENIEKTIEAIHSAHPYETPAYSTWKIQI
jgi:hypothetical protein